MPGRVRGGDEPSGGSLSYPSDRLFEEVAYLSHYMRWSYDEVMRLDHRERQRWVTEVARMNQQINEEAARRP
ncbi:DUF6760 family protein [Sorangium sp. So ce281]